jgi:hypothetical protein
LLCQSLFFVGGILLVGAPIFGPHLNEAFTFQTGLMGPLNSQNSKLLLMSLY